MAFAVSTVIAAVGAAAAVGGVGLSVYNSEKAAGSNAAAAQDQAQIAQLQNANVDTEKAQLALQTQQQQLQIATQTSVIEDQASADTIRQQAATLDATRQQRQAVRNGIMARSQSLVAATNSGAGNPGTTAIAQSNASITGQTNTNILGIAQNLEVGNQLYAINQDITSQYLNAQTQNSNYVNQSEQLQTQVLNTQKQIYSLGGDASSNYANAALSQGNAAIGAGLTSLGTTTMNAYPTINKLTNYFGSGTVSNTASNGQTYADNLANGIAPV